MQKVWLRYARFHQVYKWNLTATKDLQAKQDFFKKKKVNRKKTGAKYVLGMREGTTVIEHNPSQRK
jgi:hypothetical protein